MRYKERYRAVFEPYNRSQFSSSAQYQLFDVERWIVTFWKVHPLRSTRLFPDSSSLCENVWKSSNMCLSGKSIASYCDSGGDANGSRDIIDSLVEYYGRHLDESFQRTFRKVASRIKHTD